MSLIGRLLRLALLITLAAVLVRWLFGRGRPGLLKELIDTTAWALLASSLLVAIWYGWQTFGR